jgi:hypothetical protein
MRPMHLLIALPLLAAGPVLGTGLPELAQQWSIDGFDAPESVAFDGERHVLYVSNVNGEGDAKDGNGYISRLSLDGEVLDRRWLTGLDGPKGLAIRGDRLYATDITDLVEIDLRRGAIIARHPVPGAKFLNDALVLTDGGVLISDSANARIHLWRDGRMSVWLEDPELRSINGLLREPGRLIVTTMQGKLLAVDWKTRAIRTLAHDIGDGDGVVALGGDRYLVGEWPGRLFHVAADGSIETLVDSREGKRYINDFMLLARRGRDMLIVPGWQPGTVTAYRLKR